ncbi:MAG TPA: hypothetical protein VHM25_26870 [Polyangiaceae bacterium]|nr:hypothetical protein [Polyangiaceae bacterium]
MRTDVRRSGPLSALRDALPSEHGFWVMLVGALAGALLRTGAQATPLTVAALTGALVVAAGSSLHRRIRRSELAQLTATLLLSLSAVPVELAGGVSESRVALAAIARAIVFVSSALVVRAAFARTLRGGVNRNRYLHLVSIALAVLGAITFYASGHAPEASACAMAASVCLGFAYQRPTVKQLKPLGLALSGLVLATATALAL